jgi:hypothetical protein
MDASIPFDPLIAGAKHRTRRRRLFLAIAALALVAAGLVYGLRPSGSSPAHRGATPGNTHPALARLTVPLDATERHWRASVRSLGGIPSMDATLPSRLAAAVHDSGATVVRLTIWPGTSPAAVELVVATNVRPAVYLRHRAKRFLGLLKRPDYFKVVDARGSMIVDWGGAANEGFVGAPPTLQACAPVYAWGLWAKTPCPVK